MNEFALFILCLWTLGFLLIIRRSLRSAITQIANYLVTHDWDADFASLPKQVWLFVLGGCFILYARTPVLRYNRPVQTALHLLAVYCFYAMVIETSDKLDGMKFPNAYKIILALIGLVAIFSINAAWVNVTWAENWSNNLDSLFDGITTLFDHFFENIDAIKDFIEWLNQLNNPSMGKPVLG